MDLKRRAHVTAGLDGPLWVTDLVHFADRRGTIGVRPSLVLCRCGASANKPYCDGAHVAIGFRSANPNDDDAKSAIANSAAFADVPHPHWGDEPAIYVAPDGPYVVTGAVMLRHSNGAPESLPRCALCRCGGSNSKPFCDGTHQRIGFDDGSK